MAAVVLRGVHEISVAVAAKVTAMEEAGRHTTQAATLAVERRTKQALAESSHPQGTPTPSRPGSPPAKVSGGLGRSVISEEPQRLGVATWRGRVGVARGSEADAYARIQERGGRAGRGHSVDLPARPYFSPAFRWLVESGTLAAMHYAAMSAAIRR